MSHKRTRSSKTTPENSILIDEKVKERFDSIFKHQPMMPEKGFNLKSHDLMVVPVPIRKKINALKWERFYDARSLPDDELVREFYTSLTMQMLLRSSFERKRAHVKTQANLKGQYVQGCITNHGLERIVEKMHELNQGEQEEPTEPDTNESTNETETEANLVIGTEEEESNKEQNSPKPVE
ncbi:hypothetical protein J1N35_011663 [Gossypium stocksii]|uniref:Uncharacterized protein n=1 Tax=Gossypium stocksii TaxID=47602 RepID=A0A9D4ADK4_9ROSI|nr:hypothetical protein J1N35_011663 [Gossypium stocksii]